MTQRYLDESIQKMSSILICSGFTVESKKLTKMQKLKTRFVYILNFFWLNSDVLGATYWFIDGIQNGRIFVELTYVAPCITFSFVANLKAILFLHYEDVICDLIDNLRRLEYRFFERENRNGFTKDALRFLYLVLKCSKVLSIFLILTFTMSPLVLIAINYLKTKEVDLILPFLIIYPFDSYDIRYWPFVYLHQFWSVIIVLLNICGADYLLYICCTHLCIQFHLLQDSFRRIVKKTFLSTQDIESFQEEFVKLIKWHQELIRLAGTIELIYAKSMLFNFVSSSILICLTGFNVVTIENIAYAVMFLVFLIVNLLQIYLLCYFGDLLMKSSMEVCDAVYNCKWYNLSAKLRKDLIIVQRRAQEPCKLTAFGFSDVNLRAFMSILSSSWSYFALLKTVYNPTKD